MTDRPAPDAARAALVRDYDKARDARDVEAMSAAALGLARLQMYGTVPGRVPAFLHEAYTLSEGNRRAELAVAIARVWAYSGDAGRAVSFADEAMSVAEKAGDNALLAQALDAQLLVHWGPDDLEHRLHITRRLEDVVAHVSDVEARLTAHLWRLTTALEAQDLLSVRRQLRSLDQLADESGSPRVGLFAHSRRGMYALLTGDVEHARECLRLAVASGDAADEPDTYAVERSLTAAIARQSGDLDTLRQEAATFEQFGLSESVTSIVAEAASLWAEVGDHARAASLLRQLGHDGDFDLPKDGDWLLTVGSACDAAAAIGDQESAALFASLLAPYSGRAVVNGGAVGFVALVDDITGRAWRLLGRHDEARTALADATRDYTRLGATWWLQRLGAQDPSGEAAASAQPTTCHLRPAEDGLWWVGRDSPVAVRDLRGLHHLRVLLRNPGVDVPATTLVGAAADAGTGELADRTALASYRRRLATIDAELEQATAWSDDGRVESLEVEREAVLAELRRVLGLGGRIRTEGSTERARVAVRKAIAAAIDRLAEVDEGLATLLRRSVSTGAACRYEPDPERPVRWVLD